MQTWAPNRTDFSFLWKVELSARADLRAAEEQQGLAGAVAALQVIVQPVYNRSSEAGRTR